MKKIVTTFLAVIIFMTIVLGQTQEATTTSGKKVSLNSDGTWKYIELKQNIPKTNTTDCNNWISTETDQVSGLTGTASKKNLIVSTDGGKTGFRIHMVDAGQDQLFLSIRAKGAGNCIDEGSKINILFIDGTRLELYNQGNFNCKGEADILFGYLGNHVKELNELKTKKIKIMRVWTNDGSVEKEFTKDDQEEFFNVINCLTKQD